MAKKNTGYPASLKGQEKGKPTDKKTGGKGGMNSQGKGARKGK